MEEYSKIQIFEGFPQNPSFRFFVLFCFVFLATHTAYGSSKVRDQIQAGAAT